MDQDQIDDTEEDYTDIYKMYEEMIQIIKGGLDTPSKEIIEGVEQVE